MIPLDILSDPICPWCYIGKSNLDRAIGEAGANPFSENWRIFQLNPDMPAKGVDRKQYLERKFGGAEGAKRVYGRIAEAGRAAGLSMNLEAIPRTPNTFDAHRLIHWSRTIGGQPVVVDELFRRYFVEGRDISNHTVLTEIAESAGMDPEVVAKLLKGDADRAELEREEQAARRMGVTGVPCFIIGGRHVIQGAQDRKTWVGIIKELNETLATRQGA